jgi:hypothetical protein
MYVPSPLGSYPLVLRDFEVGTPRDGEFLLDYDKYDIYYIDRKDSTRKRLADEIYQRILEAKLENVKFKVYNKDKIDAAGGDSTEVVKDTVLELEETEVSSSILAFTNDLDSTFVDTTNRYITIDTENYLIPSTADREFNAFYFIINKRTVFSSSANTPVIDFSNVETVWAVNDKLERLPIKHILYMKAAGFVTANRLTITAKMSLEDDREDI